MPPDLELFMREYERRHAELEGDVRVLRTEFNNHQASPVHPEAKTRIELLEKGLAALILDYRVFKAQVLAYAAMGATIGGIGVMLIEKILKL